MSVLRSIEHRIESIVEGVFGRAFRTHVQPVELARKLAKEMDEAKSVSVSRVYVPNEYTLYLCPSDRDQFSSYEDSLLTELSDYLSEHARREGYALLSTPVVLMEEDEDLNVGEFGIATRMVQPERPQAPTPPDVVPQAAPSHTRVYRPAVTEAVSAEVAEEEDLARAPSTLVVAGARHELDDRVLVLGRSHDCDITVDDANVSRRHAEVRHEDGSYWIVDLGSTNGVVVNGKRVERAQLEPDDEILLGTTVVRFERGY
jgi:pSer/pThr/pTyr-binding forkhead associated (FHA) protein